MGGTQGVPRKYLLNKWVIDKLAQGVKISKQQILKRDCGGVDVEWKSQEILYFQSWGWQYFLSGMKMLVQFSPAMCWSSHSRLPRVMRGDLVGRILGVGVCWFLLGAFSEGLQKTRKLRPSTVCHCLVLKTIPSPTFLSLRSESLEYSLWVRQYLLDHLTCDRGGQ